MKQESQSVDANVNWQVLAEQARKQAQFGPIVRDTLLASLIIVCLLGIAVIVVPSV